MLTMGRPKPLTIGMTLGYLCIRISFCTVSVKRLFLEKHETFSASNRRPLVALGLNSLDEVGLVCRETQGLSDEVAILAF